MRLIVGLGNPGRNYAHNRHNVGFMCLNHFARSHGIRLDKKQGKARTGMGEVAGHQVIVARPQTYMNLSGQSVSLLMKRFNIDIGSIVVIHDDLDLPLGKIRIRQGSGYGGHKGIESIISYLGSQDLLRIRVGIGRPTTEGSIEISEANIVDYVLSDFAPDEEQAIAQVILIVSQAILCLLTEGLTAAMNQYN